MRKSELASARDALLSEAQFLGTSVVKRVEKYAEEVNRELSDLHEAIAMHQQNAHAFSIREKELVDQNDALRSANSSIHTARLDDLTDIQNLKEQVRKLGKDVQGLMNPVEIYGGTVEPAYTLRFTDPKQCQCNSCKWERSCEALKKITHPTDTNGYGVVGRPRDGD